MEQTNDYLNENLGELMKELYFELLVNNPKDVVQHSLAFLYKKRGLSANGNSISYSKG